MFVVEPDSNKRGDLFTARTADILHALGWEDFRFDVAKAGRELDVTARHRFEAKTLRAECKAESRPIGGADLNKFAGAVQVETKAGEPEVVPYFISLSGFTATAREQERERQQKIALFNSDDLIAELEKARIVVSGERARTLASSAPALPKGAVQEERTYLLAHRIGWLWLVYSTLDHERKFFTLVHADGTALAPSIISQVVADDFETHRLLVDLENAPIQSEPATDPTSAISNYRDFLRREFSSITLEGMPADETIGTRSIPLTDLYVPLAVHLESASGSTPRPPGSMATPRSADRPRLAVERFLERNDHVALVGPPGAGKSTVVKWIVTSYLNDSARSGALPQGDSDGRSGSAAHLPVVLRCRTMRRPGVTTVLEAIDGAVKQAELEHLEQDFKLLVREALTSGSLILLVDGLDEISSDSDRASFANQLRTFLGTYPSIRVVVTSRPTAFLGVASALRDECAIARVADLDFDEIRDLCAKWELQVTGSLDSKPVANEILGNRRVGALAVNPLLLTTMLLVKRWLGELPRKRSVLYGKALEVLAMTWNVEAHEPLDMDEVLPQLGYVSLSMTEDGEQSIGEGELKRTLSEARAEMPEILGYAKTSVGTFISAVESRSSILSLNDHVVVDGMLQPLYEFKHLAFQEYLSARAIVEGWYRGHKEIDSVELLRPHIGDAAWQEVVPLAAMLSGRSAAPLVRLLIERTNELLGSEDGDKYFASYQALVQCLEDEVQIPPDLAGDACKAILYGIEPDEGADVPTLLSGKFADILREAALECIESLDGAAANSCLIFERQAMLDADVQRTSWLSEVEGGLAFFWANVEAGDIESRIAALTIAMEAGYHASGNYTEFTFDDDDIEEVKVSVDTEAVSRVATRVVEMRVSDEFATNAELYAASWAMGWLNNLVSWNVETFTAFVSKQLEVWATSVDRPELVRVAAWSIQAIPTDAAFIGNIRLTEDERRLLMRSIQPSAEMDNVVAQAALVLLRYAEEDLEPFAKADYLRTAVNGISWAKWLSRNASLFDGELGRLFSKAAREQ